jgi:phosphoribosylformylglycinamidine synthase
MATDAIIAIQDMGAAGLTSSSFEMASKGSVGVELDLDRVPTRETGMSAYEIMLSESQERMLMVLRPGAEGQARAVFEKWELDFAIVGQITDTRHMVVRHHGRVVVDVPIAPLVAAAPEYDRPRRPTPPAPMLDARTLPPLNDPMGDLQRLLACPDLANKRWIWEQYDHMVLASTVQRPGGDAAVLRVLDTPKGIAATCDCTPRYCLADPREGGRQAVAEAWRNLTAVGAKPLAITDCLNFGNPEKPEIMGQFAACIEGMAEACRMLDFPVVSGNVSFYNETNGAAVPPTPTVGGMGLLADRGRMATIALKAEGEALLLVGGRTGDGWLGQSLYLREIEGREEGAPPPVDLAAERRTGDFVRGLIEQGRVRTCHDVGDGGLLVTIAEMALAGGIGARIDVPDWPAAAWLFGEDQGRYIIAVPDVEAAAIKAEARSAGVPVVPIGETGGAELTLGDQHAISLATLRTATESWLPRFMSP